MGVGEGAQVIDLCAARRLRRELADLTEHAKHYAVTHVSHSGQLSFDPQPGFMPASSESSIVIDGMQFTCTTWGGSGASNF